MVQLNMLNNAKHVNIHCHFLCRSQCFEAACKVRLCEAVKGTRELTLSNHESKGCRCASGAPWIFSA